jgi:CheY-like chemotaxis protein
MRRACDGLEEELRVARTRHSALERAAHGKDELLSLVSHDLRSALNAMVGWLYLARSPRATDEARTRALTGIDSAVTTQRRLVEQLLDASRLISGQIKPDTRVVWVHALLARIATRFEARARARPLSLEIESPPRTLGFSADPARVEESLATLVEHAFAVAPEGSSVHVRARLPGDADSGRVVLEVETAGALLQPAAPEPAASAATGPAASEGTVRSALSLSMAIAREVTELQGGTLIMESASPRPGTRLALRFPMLEAGGVAALEGAQVDGAGGTASASDAAGGADPISDDCMLGGTFILLVDDREDMLDVTATLLRGQGARVKAMLSAQEAIALYPDWARGGSERIVVSDLSMPGMDGLEMIRRLRRIEREQSLPRVPGVGFSAEADSYPRRKVIEAGFDLFLPKPIAPRLLIEGISSLIGR